MVQTAKNLDEFRVLVSANRGSERSGDPAAQDAGQQRMQLAGMRLLPEELAQAKKIARSEDRSAANFMRRIYLRGLQSYLADNGLNQPTPPAQK